MNRDLSEGRGEPDGHGMKEHSRRGRSKRKSLRLEHAWALWPERRARAKDAEVTRLGALRQLFSLYSGAQEAVERFLTV